MKMVDERRVVALKIAQRTPHPRIALAEPQVIGGVGLGRLSLGPVPAAAVLEVDDVEGVAADHVEALLKARLFTQLSAFSNTCGPMIADPTESTTPPSRFRTEPPNSLKSHSAARPIAEPLKTGWFAMMSYPIPGWTVIAISCRYACARIDARFQRCSIRIGPAGQFCRIIAPKRSARAEVSGCLGSRTIAAASSSVVGSVAPSSAMNRPSDRP